MVPPGFYVNRSALLVLGDSLFTALLPQPRSSRNCWLAPLPAFYRKIARCGCRAALMLRAPAQPPPSLLSRPQANQTAPAPSLPRSLHLLQKHILHLRHLANQPRYAALLRKHQRSYSPAQSKKRRPTPLDLLHFATVLFALTRPKTAANIPQRPSPLALPPLRSPWPSPARSYYACCGARAGAPRFHSCPSWRRPRLD